MFVSIVDFRRALPWARANAATLGPRDDWSEDPEGSHDDGDEGVATSDGVEVVEGPG